MVRLVDLVRWEVGHVDVRFELGLERRLDLSQMLEHDALEEGVALDLLGAVGAEAVGRLANQTGRAMRSVSKLDTGKGGMGGMC